MRQVNFSRPLPIIFKSKKQLIKEKKLELSVLDINNPNNFFLIGMLKEEIKELQNGEYIF